MTSVVDPHDRATAVLFGDGAAAWCWSPTRRPRRRPRRSGRRARARAGRLATWSTTPPASTCWSWRPGAAAAPPAPRPWPPATTTCAWTAARCSGAPSGPSRRSIGRTLDRPGATPTTSTCSSPTRPTPASSTPCSPARASTAARTSSTIDRYGNTSAASIPLALAEVADAGTVADGDLVLICGLRRRPHGRHGAVALGHTDHDGGRSDDMSTRVAFVTGASGGIGSAVRAPPWPPPATGSPSATGRRPAPPTRRARRSSRPADRHGRRTSTSPTPDAVDAAFAAVEQALGPGRGAGQRRRRQPRQARRAAAATTTGRTPSTPTSPARSSPCAGPCAR